MATSTAHTPVANDITRGIEGNAKWSPATLTYAFASADAADATFMNTYLAGQGLAANPY
jgi:hypothetical protein